jgi:hypothetical protein
LPLVDLRDPFLEEVDLLIEAGVLGAEQCPEQHYWRWPVLKPDELPEWLETNYLSNGEIRWY